MLCVQILRTRNHFSEKQIWRRAFGHASMKLRIPSSNWTGETDVFHDNQSVTALPAGYSDIWCNDRLEFAERCVCPEDRHRSANFAQYRADHTRDFDARSGDGAQL